MTAKLLVELVPSTSWGDNLRSRLSKAGWDHLRGVTYAKAGYVCEICGGQGPKHPVECHERWAYDDVNHVQTLVGLEALCPDCHSVRHFGKAILDGKGRRAAQHLIEVNGWSVQEGRKHVDRAFQVHQERSKHQWTLDLSWLETMGIDP